MNNDYISPTILKHDDNQESIGFSDGIRNIQENENDFLGYLNRISDTEKKCIRCHIKDT